MKMSPNLSFKVIPYETIEEALLKNLYWAAMFPSINKKKVNGVGEWSSYHSKNKFWYKNGKLHRDDGPAEIHPKIQGGQDEIWYQFGLRHRDDGPAYTESPGNERWYKRGKLHRIDGPSVRSTYGGLREWWSINGKRHRENGAAVVYSNGERQWWLNGVKYSKKEYYKIIRSKK